MTATKTNIVGLILAGGYSRRMGTDKALLNFHSMPQIEYVQGLLEKYLPQVFLSKRADQKAYKEISSIDDAKEFTGIGPLGGILSAMKAYPQKSFLVMACDLPLVNKETIETLIKNRHPQKCATAFAGREDGLPEPLCAIWEAHGYSAFLKLFNSGVHCPRKILIKSDIALIKQTDPHWLDNINTAAEYEQFTQRHYVAKPS